MSSVSNTIRKKPAQGVYSLLPFAVVSSRTKEYFQHFKQNATNRKCANSDWVFIYTIWWRMWGTKRERYWNWLELRQNLPGGGGSSAGESALQLHFVVDVVKAHGGSTRLLGLRRGWGDLWPGHTVGAYVLDHCNVDVTCSLHYPPRQVTWEGVINVHTFMKKKKFELHIYA